MDLNHVPIYHPKPEPEPEQEPSEKDNWQVFGEGADKVVFKPDPEADEAVTYRSACYTVHAKLYATTRIQPGYEDLDEDEADVSDVQAVRECIRDSWGKPEWGADGCMLDDLELIKIHGVVLRNGSTEWLAGYAPGGRRGAPADRGRAPQRPRCPSRRVARGRYEQGDLSEGQR